MRVLLDPFVTLLEVHKLLYFTQEAGEPLRLNFEEGHYGPYATNLRHVLGRMEGHHITGYKGDDAPDELLEIVPGAVEDATDFLQGNPTANERLARVSELVQGFESSFGLELLATVHWVSSARPSASDDQVIAYTYAWNPRKRQFTERQIRLALQILRAKGWLTGTGAA